MPMRVLVAHNAYRQRGGEDVVVEAETALLRSRGHEVHTYLRSNDALVGWPPALAALNAVWSPRAFSELGAAIETFRPDIVHAHNTFPLLSPSVYWVAGRRRVPVVQTLHNFRLLCVQPMLLRHGRVCEECVGRAPWRGVVHRCYRNSTSQSAVAASVLGIHRATGTYRRKVTQYVALNEFCRRKFVEGGLPAENISVKPNFVNLPPPRDGRRAGGLFVGRLSAEKGLTVLADAAARVRSGPIKVVGKGPEDTFVQALPGLEFLGWQEPDVVHELMRTSAYLVVPSIWPEAFGLVVIEAFACGLPVLASRVGALPELVAEGVTGLLFDSGSGADLARKIAWAESHPSELAAMGRRARAEYEAKYTPDRNYEYLLEIYERAVTSNGMPRQ